MLIYLASAVILAAQSVVAALEGGSGLDSDVRAVARGIRESHERLLRVPGGISLEYRLDVAQDPSNKVFLWDRGLDGVISIRWPELRCRVEGEMWGHVRLAGDGTATRESRPTVRDACYDFEKQVGVLRDSKDLGQVTDYRPSFSAVDAFPLRYQFYSEMDQHYVHGRRFETEYFLPEAIEQHEYRPGGSENIDGVTCEIIERSGLDRIWVAPGRGYVVVKREFNYGVGRPLKERVLNTQLKEVSSGLWVPMRQTRESFSDKPLLPPARFTLTVKKVRVGDLNDGDVRVVLTEDIRHIEDHITGMLHRRDALGSDQFADAIRRVSKPAGYGLILLWLNIAIALGVALLWLRRRRREPKV
jgi:hypothetical protein